MKQRVLHEQILFCEKEKRQRRGEKEVEKSNYRRNERKSKCTVSGVCKLFSVMSFCSLSFVILFVCLSVSPSLCLLIPFSFAHFSFRLSLLCVPFLFLSSHFYFPFSVSPSLYQAVSPGFLHYLCLFSLSLSFFLFLFSFFPS